MSKLTYDKSFYEQQRDSNLSSAQAIVPKVIDYLREAYGDSELSVIDLGCGSGNWLSVFKLGGGISDWR